MTTAQMASDLPKPSFAKVAAAISVDTTRNGPSARAGSSKENPAVVSAHNPMSEPASAGHSPSMNLPHPPLSSQSGNVMLAPQKEGPVHDVADTLAELSVHSKTPGLLDPGSNVPANERPRAMLSRESGSDDSQKADSSSELGTKPPSLDGKSITSGTTFALDEKESLRPDDSASVKAAADDDDAFSIRGSLIAGSRMSSDLAARARGIQLGDMPDRRLMQPTPGSSGHGVLTPQSTSSEQQSGTGPVVPTLAAAEGSTDALNLIYRHAPDDKLIEAMASSKDRLFLLKLEKEVVDFVQNSKEPYMDLPPSNSFCRMLTHKLADYYHMTHSFEPNIGSVRIFRTPFCRVPTSLAQWNPTVNPSTSSTPPPVVLPKKIMRRGQDGDVGTMSANPSKPTSEAGSDVKDGKEKPATDRKPTREEREESYRLARERIFGSSEEPAADSEGAPGMSRTSSVSANNRSNTGKRPKGGRQRRDDSDSFDSRNQYTPYWGPQQQTWVPQFAPPQNTQMPGQPPSYPAQMQPVYGQQNVGYPNGAQMAQNPSFPGYNVGQFPAQANQQRYAAGGSPATSYGSPMPGGAQPQGWQPPSFAPNAFQGRGGPPGNTPLGQPGIPYAFGQLPAHLNPYDPKSQHPIPGSYNRNHAFNPKTQSFVPGGNGMPAMQAPQPPFSAPGSHHGSPQVGPQHLAYPAYPQPGPSPYGGYGMARQASNSSVPGYHTPQIMNAPPYGQHGPMPPVQVQHQPPALPPAPAQPQQMAGRTSIPHHGPNHVYHHHLPTYGNPATLPQKPATGI